MTRLLACLLALLCLCGVALADPGISNAVAATLTAMPDIWTDIQVGPGDTLYGYWAGHAAIYRSTDYGDNWTSVFSGAMCGAPPKEYFITSKGLVFYPGYDTGKVIILHGNGAGALARVDSLTFHCAATTPKATLWNATEDTVGIDAVYVGEYGGANLDHCAYIWKGVWNGRTYTWTTVNTPYAPGMIGRHVHGMGVDPVTHKVYAMLGDRGDTTAYTNASGNLVRSKSAGATWRVVPNTPGGAVTQWLTLGFSPTRRILGTDRGGAGETNFFAYTEDDSTYTIADSIDVATIHPWEGATAPDGMLVVGTVQQSTASAVNRLYVSTDYGATWGWVAALPAYTTGQCGFAKLSNFTSTGIVWAYKDSPPLAYDTGDVMYKVTFAPFTDKTHWTIGPEGDFATVAAAFADGHVDTGDTLTFAAGKHDVGSSGATVYISVGVLFEGATGNAEDVTLVGRTGATTSAFTWAGTFNCTFRDLTFRNVGVPYTGSTVAYFGGSSAGTSDVVFDGCRFRHLDTSGATAVVGGITWSGTAGGSLTLTGCDVDSINFPTGGSTATGSYGFLKATDVDLILSGNIIQNVRGTNAAVAVLTISPGAAFHITGNLFSNCDGFRATSGLGAAFRVSAGQSVDGYFSASLLSHNTFNGCDAVTAGTGVVQFSGTDCATKAQTDHNMITTSTCKAIAVSSGVTIASWDWTNSYGTADNLILKKATSKIDTLHVDPLYESPVATVGGFMPTSAAVGLGGSSVIATDDGSYMGWTQYLSGNSIGHGQWYGVGHKRRAN